MIIVTGAAGFIGSHLVEALNQRGISDIIAVDDLTDGHKFTNLAACRYAQYLDKDDFRQRIKSRRDLPANITAIFHQGACSDTMEWDGRYMMDNNYQYSIDLCDYAVSNNIPFIYASSAAVYGGSDQFREQPLCEQPLNVYGYSKLAFDQYVRQAYQHVQSPIVGLRYFNVYGGREAHKGRMSSVFYQWRRCLEDGDGVLKLFGEYDGYQAGEQLRDFIYIKDVVARNLWFLDHPEVSGIFNCGTGSCVSFNSVAQALIERYGKGRIEYVAFPDKLRGAYQSFTEADMSLMREVNPALSYTTVPAALTDLLS